MRRRLLGLLLAYSFPLLAGQAAGAGEAPQRGAAKREADTRADFKGAVLGMNFKDWLQVSEERFSNFYDCRPRPHEDPSGRATVCRLQFQDRETIAEVPVTYGRFLFFDGALGHIELEFSSKRFEIVAAAMREKFGTRPVEKREPAKNLTGANLENTTLTWRVGTDTVVLRQYVGTFATSSATYTSQQGSQELRRAREADAAKRKSDL